MFTSKTGQINSNKAHKSLTLVFCCRQSVPCCQFSERIDRGRMWCEKALRFYHAWEKKISIEIRLSTKTLSYSSHITWLMLQKIWFPNMLTRHAGIPATKAAIHPQENTNSGQIFFLFFFFPFNLHQRFIQFATCHWIKVCCFPTTKQSSPWCPEANRGDFL